VGFKVVGAGLGLKTGTHSLSWVLEQLLRFVLPQIELFPRPEHVALWHCLPINVENPIGGANASKGSTASVDGLLPHVASSSRAAFPTLSFLLSVRTTSDALCALFETILPVILRRAPAPMGAGMPRRRTSRPLTLSIDDRSAAIAATRPQPGGAWTRSRCVSADRGKRATDGAPYLLRLGLPGPDEPFRT